MSAVSSLIRSIGNGGKHSGFNAMLISFIGLSSAATRFEVRAPHMRQRWTIAHSPFFLTQTAMGSIMPPQSAALSPGSISTCRLERQFGQWFLCSLPYSAPAHFADKSFVAGVGLVITFFILFAFVFAIHFSSRGLSCGRTAECVLFADLPVSAHSPMIL